MKVKLRELFDSISEFIFVESDIKKLDVILIQGARQFQLMERSAKLYNSGFAKYVLPSRGRDFKFINNKSEWDCLITIGINLGIPEKLILKEGNAQNTFENAKFSWTVLQSLDIPIENVILVYKTYHAKELY